MHQKQKCKTVDTFPDFVLYWNHAMQLGLEEQITLWQSQYMRKYNELLEKQLECYSDLNIDWVKIARKIFPKFKTYFPFMNKARNEILTVYQSIYEKAHCRLNVNFNITFVIYVGIGCGAGWATTYNEQPAVLLGLENIVEKKWYTRDKLMGLISHEIGHLIHMNWRQEWKTFEENEKDPLFLLYSEGFAQRCEHKILGWESWHLAPDKEWLSWCHKNRSFLAKEFLNKINRQKPINNFFGSWLNIKGKSQTGYFLGYIFIRELEKNYTLEEIALLKVEEVKKLALQFLRTEKNSK